MFRQLSLARSDFSHTSTEKSHAERNLTHFLSLGIFSFNMGNAQINNIESFIPKNGGHFDLIVVGLQETMYMFEQNDNSDSHGQQGRPKNSNSNIVQRMLGVTSRENMGDKREEVAPDNPVDRVPVEANSQHIELALRAWLGKNFDLKKHKRRAEMHLMVFTRVGLNVSHVEWSAENTGLFKMLPNKGGLCVTMTVDGTKFAFISCHVTAHEGRAYCEQRNASIANILKGVRCGDRRFDVATQFHHVFIFGDLNYRLTFDKRVISQDYNAAPNSSHTDPMEYLNNLTKRHILPIETRPIPTALASTKTESVRLDLNSIPNDNSIQALPKAHSDSNILGFTDSRKAIIANMSSSRKSSLSSGVSNVVSDVNSESSFELSSEEGDKLSLSSTATSEDPPDAAGAIGPSIATIIPGLGFQRAPSALVENWREARDFLNRHSSDSVDTRGSPKLAKSLSGTSLRPSSLAMPLSNPLYTRHTSLPDNNNNNITNAHNNTNTDNQYIKSLRSSSTGGSSSDMKDGNKAGPRYFYTSSREHSDASLSEASEADDHRGRPLSFEKEKSVLSKTQPKYEPDYAKKNLSVSPTLRDSEALTLAGSKLFSDAILALESSPMSLPTPHNHNRSQDSSSPSPVNYAKTSKTSRFNFENIDINELSKSFNNISGKENEGIYPNSSLYISDSSSLSLPNTPLSMAGHASPERALLQLLDSVDSDDKEDKKTYKTRPKSTPNNTITASAMYSKIHDHTSVVQPQAQAMKPRRSTRNWDRLMEHDDLIFEDSIDRTPHLDEVEIDSNRRNRNLNQLNLEELSHRHSVTVTGDGALSSTSTNGSDVNSKAAEKDISPTLVNNRKSLLTPLNLDDKIHELLPSAPTTPTYVKPKNTEKRQPSTPTSAKAVASPTNRNQLEFLSSKSAPQLFQKQSDHEYVSTTGLVDRAEVIMPLKVSIAVDKDKATTGIASRFGSKSDTNMDLSKYKGLYGETKENESFSQDWRTATTASPSKPKKSDDTAAVSEKRTAVHMLLAPLRTPQSSQINRKQFKKGQTSKGGDSNAGNKVEDISRKQKLRFVMKHILNKDWEKLLEYDELEEELREGRVLVGFNALKPNFPPTFKRKRGSALQSPAREDVDRLLRMSSTNTIDNSSSSPLRKNRPKSSTMTKFYSTQRIPAFCDRILYKSLPGFRENLEVVSFESCEDVTSSDHKPVRAEFKVHTTEFVSSRSSSRAQGNEARLRQGSSASRRLFSVSALNLPSVYCKISKLQATNLVALETNLFSNEKFSHVRVDADPATPVSGGSHPDWVDVLQFKLNAFDEESLARTSHLLLSVWSQEQSIFQATARLTDANLVGTCVISLKDIINTNINQKQDFKFRLPILKNGLQEGFLAGNIFVFTKRQGALSRQGSVGMIDTDDGNPGRCCNIS